MPGYDVTENYIRYRLRDPKAFTSLRTIVLSADQGIKAVVGRLKGDKKTTLQNYMFDRDKGWTPAKAKEWVSQHREKYQVMSWKP